MSTYRLVVRGGKRLIKQGTAWPVSSHLIVTAFHVVGKQEVGKWFHEARKAVAYRLEVAGRKSPLDLKPVDRDLTADIAILKSDEAFDAADVMLLGEDEAAKGSDWDLEGFPVYPDGKRFALGGIIRVIWRDGSDRDLQLKVDEGTDVSWEGASGSAICVDGEVVGVLTQEVSQAKTLRGARVAPLRSLLEKNGLAGDVRRRPAEHPLPEWFVPRDWVVKRFQQFLDKENCGYFPVVAEAGLGKTVLARAVADQFRAAAYFFDQVEGRTNSREAAKALTQQLAKRHGVKFDPHLEEPTVALGKMLNRWPREERLVIVLDATDESDYPGGSTNPALLPAELPRNVFVFLTSRPPAVRLRTQPGTGLEPPLEIGPFDQHQQEAVRAYVRKRVDEDPKIVARLAAARSPRIADQLVEKLTDRSEGNFMYVEFVLADIADSTPESGGPDWSVQLKKLPKGLPGYYHYFWNHFQSRSGTSDEGWKTWTELYRPTLQLLAAAQEGVPVAWLSTFMGRPADEIKHRVLDGWRRFLHTTREGDGQERWGAVHRSFIDYLETEHSSDLDLPATHGRIAEDYLKQWYSPSSGWSVPADMASKTWYVSYGLRHLTRHLWEAGRLEDLCRLVRNPFLLFKREQAGPDADLPQDVALAFRAATKHRDWAQMLQYALIHAGLEVRAATSSNVELLPLYARWGRPEMALELASRLEDKGQQAMARLGIARELARSEPDRARGIVAQVLAGWRDYPSEALRLILRRALEVDPEALASFLENLDAWEPFAALPDRWDELGTPQPVLIEALLGLREDLRQRFSDALERAIGQQPLPPRLPVLTLWIALHPDPLRAARMARELPRRYRDQVAHAVPEERWMRREAWRGLRANLRFALLVNRTRWDRNRHGSLRDRTIRRALEYWMEGPDLTEQELLLRLVFAPSASDFEAALPSWDDSESMVDFLLFFARSDFYQSRDVDRGRRLLFQALTMRDRMEKKGIGVSLGGVLGTLVGALTEELARSDGKAADALLRAVLAAIPRESYLRYDEMIRLRMIAASAENDLEAALAEAETLPRYRDAARALIAERLGRFDWKRAVEIWREVDTEAPLVQKDRTLLRLLQDASERYWAQARELAEKEFPIRFPYSVYQTSLVAEAAGRLVATEPGIRRLLEDQLGDLEQRIDLEGWGNSQRELYLLHLASRLVPSGVVDDPYHLPGVFWFKHDHATENLLPAIVRRQALEDAADPIRSLGLNLATDPRWTFQHRFSLGRSWDCSGIDDRTVVEFAESPIVKRHGGLVGLYLWHGSRDRHRNRWSGDSLKGLWAVLTGPLDAPLAEETAGTIRDEEIVGLTWVSLAEWLDGAASDRLSEVEQPALRPLALWRRGRFTRGPKRTEMIKEAVDAARLVIAAADIRYGLDLDLLCIFLRELAALDQGAAAGLTRQLLEALPRKWDEPWFFKLVRHREPFPVPDPSLRSAVQARYQQQAENLEDIFTRIDSIEGDREGVGGFLADLARQMFAMDPRAGLELFDRAARLVEILRDPNARFRVRRSILQFLFTIPDPVAWETALRLSLDFGEPLFASLHYFGSALEQRGMLDDALARNLIRALDEAGAAMLA